MTYAKNYNLIVLYNPTADHALFCLRRNPPYQGLYNFVGGKIEPGEDGLASAYRELCEETGVTECDVTLHPVMELNYPLDSIHMEVYAGRLTHPVQVHGDENDLFWLPLTENFFDQTRFAGMGNIGHILLEIDQDRTLNLTHPPKKSP